MFPVSNKPGVSIQCVCWRSYFCHQHWKCRNHMRNKVTLLQDVPYMGITGNSFYKNAYEQKVVNDYVRNKRMSFNQFKNDMLAKCYAAGNWEIDDALGVKQTLNRDSAVCRNWAGKVWDTIEFNYRKAIDNELPAIVQNRSDCWYGYKCRTQVHKYAHASKLNHICEPRR